MPDWPTKKSRESYEIDQFIAYYKKLPHKRLFQVTYKNENPDYILEDIETNEKFGVELTSVYLSDTSVPENHMNEAIIWIKKQDDAIAKYLRRIKEQIRIKIEKAKKNYDLTYPLILSIYINEYISIHMKKENWENFVKENEYIFDNMSPFEEIVFWPLTDPPALSIRPQ